METVLNLLFSDGIEKIETDRLIDGQKNTHTDRQTDRLTHSHRQGNGRTVRQTDRETDI